jgi:hypothetical protein
MVMSCDGAVNLVPDGKEVHRPFLCFSLALGKIEVILFSCSSTAIARKKYSFAN